MLSFLLMGQSNMSGRGDLNALNDLSNSNIFVLRGKTMEIAREPVVRDRPFSGSGLSLAFANAVFMLTGEEILLIPASLGGSSLNEWMPGSSLYENAVEGAKTALALKTTLSGILWHQGEADAMHLDTALSYNTRLTHMMNCFTDRLKAEAEALCASDRIAAPLPIIAGETGAFLCRPENKSFSDIVNRQLAQFASQSPSRALVSSHLLKDKGDSLHFSAPSLRLLGLRYAEKWAEIALF